jgi:hypothetical protein
MARVLPVVLVVVVSTVGCAQLAGIDTTSGNGRTGNSVEVTRMSVGNQVLVAPLDLSGLPARYLLSTDTAGVFEQVEANPSGPGLWTRDLADPAPVEFSLPDVPRPVPRLFAFPNQALKVLFAPLEHPDRSPAPPGATLTVTAPLEMPVNTGETFQVYTVGSWTSFALAGPLGVTQIGPIMYAFSSSNSQSERAQLDRLTAQDAFLVLRHSSTSLTGVALTGVAEAPPFEQTDTNTAVVMPTMTPVVQDQMLSVRVSPPALMTRYAAVRPGVASLVMNWSLVAAPGYRIASNTGPVLQRDVLKTADLGVTVKYGNPFVGRDWHTIFTLQTSESRTTTPLGATLPVTLFAGMDEFLEPSLVPPGPELTLPAGLPVLISLDGMQLSTDGRMIPPPNKFVEVTFLADNMNATLFDLQVFDLLPNATATALEHHLVFSGASSEARFEVPPEIFQVGHHYTLRAMCTFGGYPAIAAGDFTQRELPLARSYLDSGVITVTTVTP